MKDANGKVLPHPITAPLYLLLLANDHVLVALLLELLDELDGAFSQVVLAVLEFTHLFQHFVFLA